MSAFWRGLLKGFFILLGAFASVILIMAVAETFQPGFIDVLTDSNVPSLVAFLGIFPGTILIVRNKLGYHLVLPCLIFGYLMFPIVMGLVEKKREEIFLNPS